MALTSAFSRSKTALVMDPDLVAKRKRLAMQALSPLYESIDFVARSLVDRLQMIEAQHLTRTVNALSIEFKTSLDGDWSEFFSSNDDLNQTLADGLQRVRIGISSGLMFGGFKQCRVKKITLDTETQHFIIDLHWMSEPSRLKKLLARRH